MKKNLFLLFLLIDLVIFLSLLAYFNRDRLMRYLFQPTDSVIEAGLSTSNLSEMVTELEASPQSSMEPTTPIQVVAENLKVPWEIVFLPDGSLLVTERPGQLVRILPTEKKSIPINGVQHVGEGGLMGLVLHPDFAINKWLYIYLTTRTDQGLTNRIERYTFNDQTNQVSERKIILENIPGAQYHDGGRIEFGPDKKLYVTTGDAGDEDLAQDQNSLAGKILRLNDDGTVPADNPFRNLVYSVGHRNPQGLAWDTQGRLWSSEHGPSGGQTGNDEVNIIEAGKNYGWPTIKGTQTRDGMIVPIIESGTKDTWAPGDAEIVDDTLFFVGLRGEALYSAQIEGSRLTNLKSNFKTEYGRLRAVRLSPDKEWLYFSTSNTDGRGGINTGDDKIIRVRLSLFSL